MKYLHLTILTLLSFTGTLVHADGDPAEGKIKSAACAACHAADGNSAMPDWPKLAGQSARYIEQQLAAFKSGDRKNDLMAPMAASLSEQDMADLAAYYSSQKSTTGKASPDLVDAGEALYRGGDLERGIPACMACHGPRGSGNPAAAYPSLQGQHAAYTSTQLKAYRAGTRTTDVNMVMRNIAEKMKDADIEAVASYITGLH